MPDFSPVADHPGDLTAEWLTRALRRTEPDTVVRAVEREAIGTGQMGASFRLHLDGDRVPPTLVAKIAAGDRAARERVAPGFRKEVGFYTVFRERVAVRTPRCWYAAISDDFSSFVLLLDDLAPASPGVQADGCTVARAADAVQNLAGLPAPVWNDASLFDHADWLTPMTEAGSAFLGDVLVGATEQFLDRYATELADDAETLRTAAALTARWGTAGADAFALVHGDYRLDNLMFPAHGPGVTALDWQSLTIGPPARDLAYFLTTSLVVEDRRAHERDLVQAYVDALVASGIEDYGFEQCFDAYRLGVLQGPMITVLGCMYATAERTARADGMFLAMATRSCAALRDLDSFALLET
jgi:Phosphotransferase enzyme family